MDDQALSGNPKPLTPPYFKESLRKKDSTAFFINQEIEGLITGIADYGIFVSFENGESGLVYSAELCWPGERAHFKRGQRILVKILDFNPGLGLALSVKRAGRVARYQKFKDEYADGASIRGIVHSVLQFGVFVTIAPGMDGLIHKSDFDPEDDFYSTWREGDVAIVKIIGIDVDACRISLSLKLWNLN